MPNQVRIHRASLTATVAAPTNQVRVHRASLTATAAAQTNRVRIHRASITLPGVTGTAPTPKTRYTTLVAEPGMKRYLSPRAMDNDTLKYLKGAVLSQVSGPACVITNGTATDGTAVCGFTPPTATTTQTCVLRLTYTAAGGMQASSDFTVTVPPVQVWQPS